MSATIHPTAVIDPAAQIGDGCEIEHAIIDKNARVGAGCRLLNKAGLKDYADPAGRYYIREGIIIVAKHGILPPGTEI